MKKVTFNSVQYTSKFINANFRSRHMDLTLLARKLTLLLESLVQSPSSVRNSSSSSSAVQSRLVLTSACASSVVAW